MSDNVFEPPWNVGVAPTTAPEEDATVTLCDSGAMFVKSIVTAPAFALNEVVLYFSCPSLFAARLRVCPAPVDAAGAEEVAAVDVAGVAAVDGVEADELVLFDELPHPLNASSPIARVSAEAFGTEHAFTRPAALKLTVTTS